MLFVFGLPKSFNDARYKRDKTRIFNQDENEHGARARWMKISFPRLSWLGTISVCVSDGYTAPRCLLLVYDKLYLNKLVKTNINLVSDNIIL